MYLFRNIFVLSALLLWFYILQYESFSSLVAVSLSSPLFKIVLAVVFLKEKMSKIKILALFVAICGGMVVVEPFSIYYI